MEQVVVLTISTLLQLAAAYLAIRLIFVTQWRVAWILVAFAIFLMTIRRGLALWHAVHPNGLKPAGPSGMEWVALGISVLMVLGLASMGPLFESLRRTTQELRENEEKYRTLFDSAGGALFIMKDDRFLDCNRATLEMFRCRREEIIGQPPYKFSPPKQPDGRDSRTKALEKIKAALDGEPQVFEWEHKRADGTTFPAEVHLNRFFLSGEPYLLAVVWDLSEQKRTQEKLRRLSLAYETFIRTSLVGIWRVEFGEPISLELPPEEVAARIIDTGYFAEVNETMARMYGYSAPEEFVGKPVADIVHDRQVSIARLSEFVRRGLRYEYIENAEVDSRGQVRNFANSYVGFTQDGHLTGIWGVQIDITERVRATQALQESEAKYRALVENAGELIIVAQGGTIKYVNPRSPEILGYAPEEVLGQPFLNFVHPDDRELVLHRYEDRIKGKPIPPTYEFRVLTKSGEARWFRISAARIQWEGDPATLSFLTDVTDRVQAEEALRESEELFRTLTETTTSAIMIYRGDRLTYVNRAMEEITGYSRQELLNMPWWNLVHPDQREAVRARGLARLEGKDVPNRYEMKILRKDGSSGWVDFTARRILHRGEPSVLGTAIDITEMKLLQEQLIQSQKMEAVGRLAGGVAHDFNNILTAIRGYTDLVLAELSTDSPIRADLMEIRKAADRAADLTRQLLAFSRRQMLRPQPINLNDVLQGMRNMLGRLIGEDIRLELNLETELGTVEADPAQIQQVVLNLAVNARDAMPEGGTLLLETRNVTLDEHYAREHPEVEPGEYVMLAVTDTGVGMDEETRRRVFEPFFTTKELGKGTGLGLSTVYGIVKQSGGHIWVYSEPGQGTTFKIYLRRVQESRSSQDGEAAPEMDVRGNETILLVEDQDEVRNFAERTLRGAGYKVLAAREPAEALARLQESGTDVDLVLTDVVMPGMNGVDLVGRVRSERPGVRVIYTSGYTDNAVLERVELDADATFLQKPYTPRDLLEKVRAALDAQG